MKVHSAQLFDYLKEPLKSQLLAHDLRQAEPRFGKIDYDIDGRAVGNWFLEGTGAYDNHGGGEDYWAGHRSLVYDALDPSGVMVSIGDWQGQALQFGVKGNSPDPEDVSVDKGMVKYELVMTDYLVTSTGQKWDRQHYVNGLTFVDIDNVPSAVKGVLAVQLIESRKLKVETFLGKTADQVTGFTAAAIIYER
ncbi:MAG: hypothetical protein EXR59_02315 [Dehalococcoidia bacterium]|nr:hypothetical protein [Dehalococcoidia bacterium]